MLRLPKFVRVGQAAEELLCDHYYEIGGFLEKAQILEILRERT